MKKEVVCHISYHHALDDRIYWKELLALKEAGYDAIHICVTDKDADYRTEHGIRIIEIKRKRLFNNIWLNRLALLLFKNKSITKTILQKAAGVVAAVYHYHDLQINAIANELKNLSHQPKVIYDVHEVWWVVVQEQRKKGLLHHIKALFTSNIYKRWEIKKAAVCDYLIATDEYTLQYFQSALPAHPITIIYNYSYFLPVETPAVNKKKYDFIYTGLLSEARGIKDAVLALALLAQEKRDVTLLLIGPFETPDFESDLHALINEKQLQKNVIIKRPVPFSEIAAYYNAASIGLGLFHHTPKYSTFIPIKLFEYMAYGLPVIFSHHGPSAAIIQQANCGMLVPPQNVAAIADAMKTILYQGDLYKTFSKNGRSAVVEKYNWEKEKQKLLNVYEELLQD